MNSEMQLTELEEILKRHGEKYPLMTPRDAVKLLFQNEFGSGHSVTDKAQCLTRLKEEWETTTQNESLPLFDYIGNGIVRVNINSPEIQAYTLEGLAEDFFALAQEHIGSEKMFEKKLGVLCSCCERGFFGFSPAELNTYLDAYKKAGLSPVSHSEIYRRSYSPAYRLAAKSRAESKPL